MHPSIHRVDFLGIYDFLALNDEETIAVQTTSKSNHSSRRHKMLHSKSFSWWTKPRAHRRSILVTWYKEKGLWKPREEELTMADWEKYQADEKERLSHIDTTTPLYKTLFPNGHLSTKEHQDDADAEDDGTDDV